MEHLNLPLVDQEGDPKDDLKIEKPQLTFCYIRDPLTSTGRSSRITPVNIRYPYEPQLTKPDILSKSNTPISKTRKKF